MVFLETFWQRLIEIVLAPALNPSMFWIIMPLFFTLLLMTFYFGAHKREELGYSSAVANSVVLLFVGVDLFKHVFNLTNPGHLMNFQFHPISTVICFAVILEAFTLMFASFFKSLPKQITFFFCAPVSVNLQAYLAIAIVYTNITLDWYTLLAALLLFVVVYILLKALQFSQRQLAGAIHEKKLAELDEEKKEATRQAKAAELEKKQYLAKDKAEKALDTQHTGKKKKKK
ncbi:hypothetical protein KY333_04340 [Candidatus Woesearchaeota archaeon]|nr:hypothetical protein [Candidatus Woesearchaeota archaeon]MBW2994126.1 hypothetical protein [Candidatus Woesearchaeota archaeon]